VRRTWAGIAADLDLVLHARAREAKIAIKPVGGTYTCPTCGKNERPAAKPHDGGRQTRLSPVV
jgi:hypothetical protein